MPADDRSQFHQHLQAAFAKKLPNQNVIRGKLLKAVSYEKGASKMLMKLTLVVDRAQQ